MAQVTKSQLAELPKNSHENTIHISRNEINDERKERVTAPNSINLETVFEHRQEQIRRGVRTTFQGLSVVEGRGNPHGM